LKEPRLAVGKSTTAAMLSGAVFGYRGLVREIIARIKAEQFSAQKKFTLSRQVGYARLIAARLPEIGVVRAHLTLEGLRIIANLNVYSSRRQALSVSRFFRRGAEKSSRKSNFPLVRWPEPRLQSLLHESMGDDGGGRAGAWLVRSKTHLQLTMSHDQSRAGGHVQRRLPGVRFQKFPEALKQLDAIDARQPDLAASKNLRGVILMRQGNYDQAESALQEAARIDPKFWKCAI